MSDILEFKVTDTESLEQLTKEFNKQLANMGKQQIVFSEKTLQGIVSQFANAISDGITKGIADVDLSAQFKQLENQKADLIKKQKVLTKKQREYEDLSSVVDDLPYMDENKFAAFSKEEMKKMDALLCFKRGSRICKSIS